MKIRIPTSLLRRPHRTPESSPIPKAYRPWVMASLAILVLSLLVLAVVATVAFVYYANVLTPIWLVLLGAVSAAGVALGFGGLFLLLALGAYSSFKEDKIQVPTQIDPPEQQ